MRQKELSPFIRAQKALPPLGQLVSLFVRRSLEAGPGEDEGISNFLWDIRLNGEADAGRLGSLRNRSDRQSQTPTASVNDSLAPSSTNDESVEERTRKLFFPYE